MEYYSFVEKNKVIPFAGKWMELKIMLSEVNQTENDRYHMFSLLCRI
jgi:hypothetical protein